MSLNTFSLPLSPPAMSSELAPLPPVARPPPMSSLYPLPIKGEDNGATCVVCGAYLRRNTDMPRHMLIHSKDKESLMFRCPMDGCGHQTLQKSNLATHIRTHTRAKPHKCPESFANGQQCDFSTADPSSLHRHRKRKHGYTPKPKPPAPKVRARAGAHARASPPAGSFPLRAVSAGPSMEGMDADTNEDLDVDAEGEPASDCESEESFGLRAGGSMPPASGPVTRLAEEDDDVDLDGEGEPDNEQDAEPLSSSSSLLGLRNVSAERMEPPPQARIILASSSLPPSSGERPVLANISDTRTAVDV